MFLSLAGWPRRGFRGGENSIPITATFPYSACSAGKPQVTDQPTIEYAKDPAFCCSCACFRYGPEDFIARLAALVPKPRAHLTRYHGVFAPASPDRVQIVPSTRAAAPTERGEVSVSDRQRAMSWAQRLKRVFAIDIETCRQCGGHLRVIASIEAPAVIGPVSARPDRLRR